MVEILMEEFVMVGLELNASKTKIITNACPDFDFLDIGSDMVEIIQAHSHHKYLGRYLSGETAFRENVEGIFFCFFFANGNPSPKAPFIIISHHFYHKGRAGASTRKNAETP